MAAPATQPGQPASPTQPQSGDSRLAAILAKQHQGETLTAAERGYLGSVKRKGARKAAPAPSQNILLEVPPNPENPLFEAAPANDVPGEVMAVTAVDTALVQGAANAILNAVDTTTKLWIGHEAKQAGASPQTVEDYKAAVALQPGNRQLMVENSEPVVLALCKFFNCTPDKLEGYLKNSGFVAGMIAHGISVVAAVKSIRESRAERPKQPPASPGASQA